MTTSTPDPEFPNVGKLAHGSVEDACAARCECLDSLARKLAGFARFHAHYTAQPPSLERISEYGPPPLRGMNHRRLRELAQYGHDRGYLLRVGPARDRVLGLALA